jgi:selenocysteine-specific elongation factor
MLREECKSKMLLEARAFNGLIAYFLELDWLKEIDGKLALAEFRIEMNQTQRERVDELLARFAKQPTAPPSVKDCRQAVGEAVYQHLLERGSLVQVSEDVVFAKDDFQAMSAKIKACATGGSTISVAEARDIFQTSRKFILALMEYLDANGLTRREGDVRVWIAPDQDR